MRSGVVLSFLRFWPAPAMVAVLAASGLGACSSSSSPPPATSSPGTGGQVSSSGSGGAATGGGTAPSGSGGSAASGSGGSTTAGTGGTGGPPSSGSGGGAIASGGAGPAGTGGGAAQGSGGGVAGKSGGGGSGPGAGGGATGGKGPGAGGDGFVDLFNGTDLTGFNVYKATTTANNAPGMLLTGADALAIFKPENGTIHVYADQADKSLQYHYLLQTVNPYANFNVSWEYKWGTKKFALDGTGKGTDLVAYPRDAGVLWYIHGDKTQIWPSSIEFQNKWGTSGDIFALYAQCKSLGMPNNLTQYAAGGVSTTVIGGLTQHKRSDDFETPGVGADASNGGGSDWNTCLLSVTAGTSTYSVNGHVVNGTLGVMDSSGKPVTSGYLAWQGEQAEVYYRNLRIQVLP